MLSRPDLDINKQCCHSIKGVFYAFFYWCLFFLHVCGDYILLAETEPCSFDSEFITNAAAFQSTFIDLLEAGMKKMKNAAMQVTLCTWVPDLSML